MPTSIPRRALRHLRLSLQAHGLRRLETPPFLILFVNSICNLKCEHCFVHDRLNRRDDLSYEEIVALSEDLGPIENLNLSGGEPFLRQDLSDVCLQFITQNGVRQIYSPTSGYFTQRTIVTLEEVLASDTLELFACELSLDGMPAFHNAFRGDPKSFRFAMQTYDALAKLQERDPRLRIHAVSTATADNVDEIKELTTYLHDRCPRMDHHHVALIRGDRKNPSLRGPDLQRFCELDRYVRRLWAQRETDRFGSIVDPMLTWAKVRTSERREQVVPCKAGTLSAVIYANGDVGVCETLASHPVLGNLREKGFRELWDSQEARAARRRIRAKECCCTNEVFLWPSVTFQPLQLARAAAGARIWRQPPPLDPGERVAIEMDEQRLPVETSSSDPG